AVPEPSATVLSVDDVEWLGAGERDRARLLVEVHHLTTRASQYGRRHEHTPARLNLLSQPVAKLLDPGHVFLTLISLPRVIRFEMVIESINRSEIFKVIGPNAGDEDLEAILLELQGGEGERNAPDARPGRGNRGHGILLSPVQGWGAGHAGRVPGVRGGHPG